MTFNEIKNIAKLSKPLHLLKDVLDVNAHNKDLPDSFVIETDQIIEVTASDKVSYSFKILNPTDSTSVFENFIIDVSNPTETKYFIFKYKYKDTFERGEFPFEVTATNLSEYQIEINDFQINLTKWELCIWVDVNIMFEYTIDWWDCSGSGQGIDMGGDDGDSDSGDTDSDSGNTSENENNTGYDYTGGASGTSNNTSGNTGGSSDADDPDGHAGVNFSEIEYVEGNLTNLSDEQIAWLYNPNHSDEVSQIAAFLDHHSNSPEVVSFVIQSLNALINGLVNSFDEIVIVDMPENPFTGIQAILDCFDTTSSAYLTIYSSEPNPGTGDTHNGNMVGHSFVSIKQGDNVCTVGFYPTSNWISPFNNSSDSILGNDGGEIFTVSVRNTISSTQLQNIINYISNTPSTYNLNTYNCTDFAIQVGNLGGIQLPDCSGSWPGGSGSNPGTLGQYIRTHPSLGTINTTTSLAVSSNQGC